jgi:hypothetical protein
LKRSILKVRSDRKISLGSFEDLEDEWEKTDEATRKFEKNSSLRADQKNP